MQADAPAPPYQGLTPDLVLDALGSLGLRPDGRQQALNSFENRVYQLWMEEGPALVAKFYRPARWSEAQLLEEHAFATELAAREIPVVAPLEMQGRTLHEHGGFRFAVYPRRGGRAPELENEATLEWIGRFLGRIHAAGATSAFRARETHDLQSFGKEPRAALLASGFIPADLLEAWQGVTAQALEGVAYCYERCASARSIRLHGDCHAGNILWTDEGPHFVDFDDARMGPAMQDLWMLLSGSREAMARQLQRLLAGYEQFMEFDRTELNLLEALRTLRLVHYSAWLARRWHDPAFPAAFPWFGSQRYWQDRILELREQIPLMQEPPLEI